MIEEAASEIHCCSIGYAPQSVGRSPHPRAEGDMTCRREWRGKSSAGKGGIRRYRKPPRRAQCAFDDRRLSKALLR